MHSRRHTKYQRSDDFSQDNYDNGKKMSYSKAVVYVLLFFCAIACISLGAQLFSSQNPRQVNFKTPEFPSMMQYEDFPDINIHDVQAKAVALLKPSDDIDEEKADARQRQEEDKEEQKIIREEALRSQEKLRQQQREADLRNKNNKQQHQQQPPLQLSHTALIEDSLVEAKGRINELRVMKYEDHVVMESDPLAQDRIRTTQTSIRKFLTLKYGPGPYYVKMVLQFPDSMMHKDLPGNLKGSQLDAPLRQEEIIIELAPIDYVPYSVYMFLENVVEGYKGGEISCVSLKSDHACVVLCVLGPSINHLMYIIHYLPHTLYSLYAGSFHRNAGHVLQAMVRSEDTQHHQRHEKFAWQEYSPHYPHKKYTLGYAGRPSSNGAFYISTQDNVRNHGPASQGSKSEADR
jgi:hypothetical protein